MADEYTREWKFRAWNPTEKKMLSPEDLEEPDTAEDAPKTIYGGLIDGVLHIKDYKTDPPTEYVFQQSTNWYDREQYEIYEGDIVRWMVSIIRLFGMILHQDIFSLVMIWKLHLAALILQMR